MNGKIARLLTLVMVLAMIASPAFASPLDSPIESTAQPPTAAPAAQAAPVFQAAEAAGPALYIVQLQDASLASYTGGIPGLRATSPQTTGARKLNANSPASQAYLSYLEGQQAAAIDGVSSLLGRSVDVAFQYLAVLNAFAVTLSPDEAAQVAKLPEVKTVWRDVERELDTDVGPIHIGAPAIWNGQTGTGAATRGESVVLGIIDSGINSQHPSFAATDGGGYTHANPYGVGVYKGWCATNAGFCNSKLIAAYGLNPVGGSPEDLDGHGSHTASTSGGNAHTASFNVGPTAYNIPIQGVAPRANIVAYKVCNPSCPGTASVAAVNSAILNDQVDVLNYSISGSDSPWNDPVDLAFLDASNAGVYTSASAGNSGPGASTTAHSGPWNAAVAASTINRVIANTLDVTGPTTPPALQGMPAVPGENTSILANLTGPIRYNAANSDGCVAFSAGYFSGALALIQRGNCTFLVKVTNAAAAGATGVIIFNNVGGPPISMGGGLTGTPPAFMLDLTNGAALRDYVVANPTAPVTVRVNVATSYLINNDWEDIVAGFSSRGPSQFEVLKPDYIAPGVNILAAYVASGGNPVQYSFLQGTSMSSPHSAGSAALMVGLYPSWTPAEIKSALASSATGGLVKENGVTPADPFDVGSGLLALGGAANVGLVFNETGANYLAANPAIGGDPKTLNQPSMANYNCGGSCSWTRTVKAVVSRTWNVTTSAPAGMTITVTPNNFALTAGQTQVLTITANVSGLPLNQFAFGSVTLTPVPTEGQTVTSAQSLPVVVKPTNAVPDINVTPTSLAATQAPGATTNQTLNIGNIGTGPLTWQIAEAPNALRLPIGVSRGAQEAAAAQQVTIGDATLSRSTLTPGQVVTPERSATPDALVTITHSASQAIVTGNSVACNAGGLHTDNSYLRQFDLSAFGISAVFNVTQVQVGVEQAVGAGGSQPLTVNLYTKINPAGALTWANLSPIGTASATVTDQSLTLLTVPVVGAAPAGSVLVVEVFTPNGQTAGNSFFVGSNAAGQTAPSYLAAAGCGVTEPTDTAAIGFPGMHIVMNVTGDTTAAPAACDAPADVPWLTVTPTGGTTPAGESRPVTVGFNSTGLALGTYNAVLCVTSNDPQTPLVEVPVSLTVQEQGGNVVEVCRTPNVAIPDGNPTGVSDTITVPDALTILDFDVYIRAPHTWVGDLAFTLQHVETATTATLINRPGNPTTTFGCSGDNYDVTVNDEGPNTPIENQCGATAPAITGNAPGGDPPGPVLAAFDGQSTQGNWVLTATDAAAGDIGTLVEWCVRVTVPAAGDPNINVSPASMASTQAPGATTNQTLNVGNTGGANLTWNIFEEATAAPELADWSDNFDSYATGSQLHGQGGWKGWNNDPTAGALTSGAQFRSSPNSAAILGASDLVHQYAETDGQWVYTAWQYVPTDYTGGTVFILLNTYVDSGAQNWSTQVRFDGATNQVLNDGGVSGGTLALVKGQWVELRVEINLDADTQSFYYNNQLLYSGTWSGQVSGSGATSIAAVDLFADSASVVYYDDMSLVNVSQPTVCSAPGVIPWASVSSDNGVTTPGDTTSVQVTFNSSGLALGTYTGNLCVASNDPDAGPGNGTELVVVPLRLVVEGQPPNIDVDPLSMSATQPANTSTQQLLNVANTGGGTLNWTIDEEDTTSFPTIVPGPLVAQPAAEVVGAPDGAAPAAASGPAALWQAPDAILYDNGPLVTSPGAGFGGADASVLQTNLGLSTFGFGHAVSSGFRMADDFTVPAGAGWMVDSITFFAYQTGSTTTSTIDAVNLRIWDGPPGQGGSTVVFGDTTTNRLSNTAFMNAYRVTDTAITGNTRPIMADTATVNTYLAPGAYWVDWQTGGTLASGPWAPPVSIVGQTAKPGANGVQYDPTAMTWNPALDTGTAQAVQDLPFVIEGTAGVPECEMLSNIPWLDLNTTAGSNAGGTDTDVTVTFDSRGLAVGAYTGNLCVTSNDPDAGPGNGTELVIVPVELVVTEPSAPAIELVKTVGTTPGVCAPDSNITVPAGTEVYYCYTVTNTGDVTLNLHGLVDDPLGMLFTGFAYALTPGSSVSTVDAGLTFSAIINAPTLNTATWTAYNTGGASVMAEASAFVDVIYFSCQNPIEDFENGVPPWGWSVVNNVPGGPTWGNIASCGPNANGGNYTGGAGDAACMSASSLTAGAYDAELRSPVFSLVGYSDSTISYLANYQNWAGIDRLNFDISSDGGVTWTTLRSWNSDQGAFQNTPGVFPTVDLAAYLGQSNLMLRWHYFWNNPAALGWYAQIDEAEFKCVRIPPTAVTLDSLSAVPAPLATGLPLAALPAVVSLALGAAYALRRRQD